MTDYAIDFRRPGIDFAARAYDWAPFLKIERPAVARVLRGRILGFGYDISWNQNIRFYTVKLGHRRLLCLAVGRQMGPIEPAPAWAEPLRLPESYVQFTLLGLDFGLSRKHGVRVFFLNKRVL